jgi:hypothetical protein
MLHSLGVLKKVGSDAFVSVIHTEVLVYHSATLTRFSEGIGRQYKKTKPA